MKITNYSTKNHKVQLWNQSQVVDEDRIIHRFFPENEIKVGREYCLINDINFTYSDKDKLYYDIETKVTKSNSGIGDERILSIGTKDGTGNEYFLIDKNEGRLLQTFYNLIQKYDMIIGYNTFKFDYPFLKKRGKKHGIDFKKVSFKNIDLFRMMDLIQLLNKLTSKEELPNLKLATLGEKLLDIEPFKLESRSPKIFYEMFKNNQSRLKEYNMQDVRVTKQLDEHFNITKIFEEISKLANIPIYKISNSFNKANENLILKEIYRRCIEENEDFNFYWNKLTRYSKERGIGGMGYSGAYVKEVKPDLYENVVCYDITSLYPNLIRTLNISFDTLKSSGSIENCVDVNGVYFSNEKDGVLKSVEDKLFKLKSKFKKKGDEAREIAAKTQANALYGYFGSKWSNFKNKFIAKSVTAGGRILMKTLDKELSNKDIDVIYVDTDSLLIKGINSTEIDSTLDTLNRLTERKVYKEFKPEFKNTISFGFERHYDKMLFQSKKRYTGLVDYDEDGEAFNWDTKGIEFIKKSSCVYTKKVLKGLRDLIFNEMPLNKVINYLSKKKRELYDKEVPLEELILNTRISKPYDDYKVPPLHARIAHSENIPYFQGSEVRYILTGKVRNKIQGKSFDNAKEEDYDSQLYWKRRVYPAVERFLNVIHPDLDFEELKIQDTITKQKSLMEV